MSASAEFSGCNPAQDCRWVVAGEVGKVCMWIQKQNLPLVARLALVSVVGDSIAPQARKCDCLMFETDLMLKPRNWSITVVCFYFSREKAIIPTGSPKITILEGGRKKKEKGRLKWRGKLLLCSHNSLEGGAGRQHFIMSMWKCSGIWWLCKGGAETPLLQHTIWND